MSAPRKLGEIYRESGGETPPAALDAAVLDAARAAAETARARPTRGPWHRRWLAPAGLALSLLLGIGLALQIRQIEDAEEVIVQAGAPQPPSAAPERAADAAIRAPKAESAVPAPQPASVPAPPPPARSEADTVPLREAAPARAVMPDPLAESKRQRDGAAAQAPSGGVAADAAAGLASPRSFESQALPAPAPAAPSAAQKAAERATPAFRASAVLWLAEIRRQLAAGQRTSAAEELHAYVKVHGLASVPEELRTLLTP